MERRTYIFAGGGTGGHLYPGISVAGVLRRLEPEAEIQFFCTPRESDRRVLEKAGFPGIEQSVRPWPARVWRWPEFVVNWCSSVSAAKRFMRERKTEAVLGLGGYAAGPAVAAGHALGVRTGILNPDAVPGKANRKLARCANLVAMQWEASRRYFGDEVRCRTVGCPVREGFGEMDAGEGRRRLGLGAQRPVLLVTGASQGSRSVNQAVLAAWPEFHERFPEWRVLHLTGKSEFERVAEWYAKAGARLRAMADGQVTVAEQGDEEFDVLVVDYTHEMPAVLSAADLVVSRAGASTLAELTVMGKASILMPYPYDKNQHQRANGQVLVEAGAAIMIDDLIEPAMNRALLTAALGALAGDAARRSTMSAAARSLGRPNAARVVAEWMAQGT